MALPRRSVAIFIASLVMGTSLPMAASQSMQASFISQDSILRTTDGTSVLLHRSYSLRDRYDYNEALQTYEILTQQGYKNLVRPDINDRPSIDVYLKSGTEDRITEEVRTDPVSTTDYVKVPVDLLSEKELSQQERAALSRAMRIGRCDNYKGFSEGYMPLCKQLIRGKTPINTLGLSSDIQNTKVKQRTMLRGSTSSKSTLFDGLINNRTVPRIPRMGISSSSSSSR
ncbi:MAG: hypothetical protein HOO67_04520 [Candidatus Peribacteraceae bacterium]|nr:hypothetical protein [Candidatus Peribacteraceae bacterium]